MFKTIAIGTTALFLTGSSIACAQSPQTSSPAISELSASDRSALTEMRVELIKAALQMTPEQEKLWPAVETAIRAGADDRRARVAKMKENLTKLADESRIEVMRNRDPIAFLKRRAQALAQRSADLEKLADAWQPLYATLSQQQRQRMAAVAIFVVREMSDAAERRRAQSEDDDD